MDLNRFNPKTFFTVHDINSSSVLDEQELEALFTKELEKVSDPRNEDDDMREMKASSVGAGDEECGHQPRPPCDPGGIPSIHTEGVWGH